MPIVTARTLKATVILDPASMQNIEAPEGGHARTMLTVRLTHRTLSVDLASKAIRKAQAVIDAHGVEGTAIIRSSPGVAARSAPERYRRRVVDDNVRYAEPSAALTQAVIGCVRYPAPALGASMVCDSSERIRTDLGRARAAAAWAGGASQCEIARSLGYVATGPVSLGIKRFLQTYGGPCTSDPVERKALVPAALRRFEQETGISAPEVPVNDLPPAPVPPLQPDVNRAYAAGRWALGARQEDIGREFGVSATVVHFAIRRFLDRYGDPEDSWRSVKLRVPEALRRFQAEHGRQALILDVA
jgi:hypothetical protein